MSTTKTEERDFDLAPHEQLDEIDLRTNDDGTVQVKVLGWEKHDVRDNVDVRFRTPAGEVKTERMSWPQSNNSEYKFIRLINETPYTLRTADQINEDDELWMNANPKSWELDLTEPTPLFERLNGYVSGDDSSIPKELLKIAFFPVVIIIYAGMLFDYDISYDMSSSVVESREQQVRLSASVKTIVYLILWLVLVAILVSI